MRKKSRNFLIFLGILFFLILTIVFITLIGPDKLVEKVGVKNTYFITFLAALITGVSALTGVYFYTLMISFGIGGANPFLLGIYAGIGLTISDWLFYYLGIKGRAAISEKNLHRVDSFSNYIKHKPEWLVPLIVLIYTSLSPFPTDIIMASVGMLGIKFRRVVVPLFLGNVISSILVVYFATEGFSFLI